MTTVATTEQWVDAGDARICAAVSGPDAAPALLLLPGGGGTAASWDDDLVARLVHGGYRVIRIDPRDSGRSSRVPAGGPRFGLTELAADAAVVIDALAGGRAHVLGLSLGGMVAMGLALDHPDRVRSLTLVATTPDMFEGGDGDLPGPEPRVLAAFEAETAPDWADRDAAIAHLAEAARPYAGTPERFDLAAQREAAARELDRSGGGPPMGDGMTFERSPGWRQRLGEIAASTLVIHGSADPMFPLPHGEALARVIPGARLLVVAGMGHEYLPPWARDEVIPAILTHLARA